MNYNYCVSSGDFLIIFEVMGFTCRRPAPPCSNPSSPAYTDSGDNADWEDIFVKLRYETKHNVKAIGHIIAVNDDVAGDLIEEYFGKIIESGEKEYFSRKRQSKVKQYEDIADDICNKLYGG